MFAWALIAHFKKRADLADIAWGLGFVFLAWLSFFLTRSSLYGLVINALVTLWGLRLTLHIYLKNRNRPEDFRYRHLKIFSTFLVQGIVLYIVALPILWIHLHPKFISWNLFLFAIPFWGSGFLLEAISDYQLLCFLRKPHHGKLLTTGFWSYARHPNYLGEITQWWALWALSLSIPFGWAFVISPLLLTFLIIKVSGVAPLEKKMEKYPGFETYAKKTPSLFPSQFVNGYIYFFSWMALVYWGNKSSLIFPILVFFITYAAQLVLFFLKDKISLLVCIPLSIYATFICLLQEMAFIHWAILRYPDKGFLPPLWLLVIYPLIALTMNSALSFLNDNLKLAFLTGGAGALLSYISGAKIGAGHLFGTFSYITIFLSWGTCLTLLVLINRHLLKLSQKYTTPLAVLCHAPIFSLFYKAWTKGR